MSGPRIPPRPPQSPHTPYNPQNYAPNSSPPSRYAHHPPPLPPGDGVPTSPRPYNPAAYQDNSIANAANQIYGPPVTSQPAPPRPSYQPASPGYYQPQYPTSPQRPYGSHMRTNSIPPTSDPYSGAAQPSYQNSSYQNPASPPPTSTRFGQDQSMYLHSPQSAGSSVPQDFRPSPAPSFQSGGGPSPSETYNNAQLGNGGSVDLHLTSSFGRVPGQGSHTQSSSYSGQQPDVPNLGIRHPQSRPLPGPPLGNQTVGGARDSYRSDFDQNEARVQQDLFDEVENALNATRYAGQDRASYDYSVRDSQSVNGSSYDDPRSTGVYSGYYDDYGDDDSDAEAAAGLEAMRMAEQQEADDQRLRSNSGGSMMNGAEDANRTIVRYDDEDGSDEDYHNVDMGAYGGGYQVHMPYGDSATLPVSQELSHDLGDQHLSRSSRGTGTTGTSSYPERTDSQTSTASTNIIPNAASARVDEAGTGGLSDPSMARKLSFDNNDPAEVAYLAAQTGVDPASFDQLPAPPSRPLPSIPASHLQPPVPHSTNQQPPYLIHPDHYQPHDPAQVAQQGTGVMAGPYVPRSQSLAHSTVTQQAVTPIRARTDAEERKRLTALRGSTVDLETSFQASGVGLDLPAIPAGRRLQPSKLRLGDYERCTEPWALSSIINWLRSVAEGDPELRTHTVEETLVNLFMHKVPNMNIAMSEALSAQVISRMLSVGTLVLDEEWLRFGPEHTTGVLFQLTGLGCYSQKVHASEGRGRCYSHFCQRTVRKIDLREEDSKAGADWATFYGIKKEDVEHVDRKEIERQNNLHEIIQSEYHYMNSLKTLRTLYWDNLEARKNVMNPQAYASFVQRVFGKLDAVQRANEDFLLPQLKYRQKEQGPWVIGFSDIFRDWIRKAKPAYIDYTANFPTAEFTIRQEDRRNLLYHNFLNEARNNPSSQRLAWDNYLKSPITKIQRYSLLLQAVLGNMRQDSEEKTNLQLAITEIQEATRECNARLDEETRKIALADLKTRLILRPEMKHVELNLTQWGREIVFSGDLQRTGTNKFTWLESHVMLLDNYLVLAKTVINRDTKSDLYDVSKMPIPMDLLQLESNDDDPVVKSSMKGIASVSSVSSKASLPTDARATRTNSSQNARPGLPSPVHSNTLTPITTNSSGSTTVTNTVLEQGGRDEKILYPFRIRHLGKEVYTLFASSAQNRKEWCDKIVSAKTKHAASLFTQNAEPFRLKVLADVSFAYDTMITSQRSVSIKGTPLVRAIEDVERTFVKGPRPAPVCRARVNCSTAFKQPDGRQMIAIGTDYGVYLTEAGSPRGWTRAIPALRVTQVAVLEEFCLLLLISDKSLIAYHLDIVCPPSGVTVPNDSMRKAPQKLSGSRDVGFFAVGRMKDRTLVFYEKRDGRSSVFKVLEPVYQKSVVQKPRHHFFRAQTDYFRDYDDFYIPADCTAIDLFSTSLSVATARGFEVLNLDKKQPWSIPDLKAPHVATIAQRLQGMDPVAMFRLAADGSELLCVYEECAVYVNKYGDVSRSVVMEFVGRARSASLIAGFLVLFDQDFVEVRDAMNGRLKQVVAGRDVRCLDSARLQTGPMGVNEQRTVKFALQHPEVERAQIVVELVLNESRRV